MFYLIIIYVNSSHDINLWFDGETHQICFSTYNSLCYQYCVCHAIIIYTLMFLYFSNHSATLISIITILIFVIVNIIISLLLIYFLLILSFISIFLLILSYCLILYFDKFLNFTFLIPS